jgi:hypothetical protein
MGLILFVATSHGTSRHGLHRVVGRLGGGDASAGPTR